MARKPPSQELVPGKGPGTGLILPQPAVEAKKSFLAKNTVRAYVRDWKDFFEVDAVEKITTAMALAITPEYVADFRDRCIEKDLGPGTVSRKLASVRAFFAHLILRGVLAVNPAHPKLVRAPKRGTVHKMEWLAADEVKRLLRAIDRSTVAGRRDYAMIMIDLHMGLRRSEVLAMKVESLKRHDDQAYYVFRSKGEKERPIALNRDVEVALAAYAEDRGRDPGWLFPGRKAGHLSGDQFWRIVQKYLKAAGIKKKVGTHGLRATFITRNMELGTPLSEIQKTVGHSRGETTLGYARDLEAIKSRAPKAMEGLNADAEEEGKRS